MPKWDKEEVDFLAMNTGLSTKEISIKFCDKYGSNKRSYDSIQKKVKQLRDVYAPDFIEEVDDPAEEQAKELATQVEEMLGYQQEFVIADITSAKKREIKEEAKWWLEGLIEASEYLDFPQFNTSTKGESTLCVLVSDLHVGKQNKQFNLQIARERIESIPEKIYATEGKDQIDEVCIMLLGDLVEGEDIYQTQAHHIECSAIEQMQLTTTALWDMILTFKEIYDCPIRVRTVPGNHGRMSKTANEKTNWDNVIHHTLRVVAAAHKDDNITIEANFEMFHVIQVKDKTGMLCHHGVKHVSTPATREKVAGWSVRKKFDFMCHAHWHEWHVGNWLGKVVVSNGCLCGPDDLAEKMGKEDTARQSYFYVTPGQPLHRFGVIEWED